MPRFCPDCPPKGIAQNLKALTDPVEIGICRIFPQIWEKGAVKYCLVRRTMAKSCILLASTNVRTE